MTISVKTRKLLWGKSASRCSFPECKMELVMDETETDDVSIVGEECHIIAREDDGPRGNSDLSKKERDKYGNLILMCNVHHKLIDDQEHTYTVEILKEFKNNHEAWVSESLKIDDFKFKDDLIYSSYIDKWAERVDLDNWKSWTSGLLSSSQPSIYIDKLKELEKLRIWMFSRIMPNRYLELEMAFENFRLVLGDLINTFKKHAVKSYDIYDTEKFYSNRGWNDEFGDELLKEYFYHVDLVMDLTIELTRAANFLCDQVRRYLLSDFRLEEGLLLITSGPDEKFNFNTYGVNYKGDQRKGIPYRGLEAFKMDRSDRDLCIGVGRNVLEAEALGTVYL